MLGLQKAGIFKGKPDFNIPEFSIAMRVLHGGTRVKVNARARQIEHELESKNPKFPIYNAMKSIINYMKFTELNAINSTQFTLSI